MKMNSTLSSQQLDALSSVYIALLTPSVIGSFSVLVVSLLRWRNLQEQVHLLVQLALADLLAAVVLMSTSVTNKVFTKFNSPLCFYGLPLSLTFFVISFLLVVIYAWKSKNAIQGWRTRPAECEDVQSQCGRVYENKVIYILVWSLPLVMYFAYTIPNPPIPLDSRSMNVECCNSCILFLHTLNDNCSRDDDFHAAFINIFLFFMVIEVLSTCCAIYYEITTWYKARQEQGLFPVEGDGQSRKRFKRVFSTARNMVLVIIICWTPALILIVLLFLKSIEQSKLFTLYIIQAATVSLQGFMNSMVYAWKRPNFTEAVLGERTPLVAYNHVSFFEESLRTTV